jgi:hypothetical protein
VKTSSKLEYWKLLSQTLKLLGNKHQALVCSESSYTKNCRILLLTKRIYITNSMEVSPSWEAASCAAAQKLPNNLWNPKVYYCVKKSPALVSILNQINPVHTIPYYLGSILVLSTHLHLSLPSGTFLSSLPTNIPYAFLFSPFVLHALPISTSLTLSF